MLFVLAQLLNEEGSYETAHVCPHCDLELVLQGLWISLVLFSCYDKFNDVVGTILPMLMKLLGRDCLEIDAHQLERVIVLRAYPSTIRDFRVRPQRSRVCAAMGAKRGFMQRWRVLEKAFSSYEKRLSRKEAMKLVDMARKGRIAKPLNRESIHIAEPRVFRDIISESDYRVLIDEASAKLIQGAITAFFKTLQVYLGRVTRRDAECEYCHKSWDVRGRYVNTAVLSVYTRETGVELLTALGRLQQEVRREFLPWLAHTVRASFL